MAGVSLIHRRFSIKAERDGYKHGVGDGGKDELPVEASGGTVRFPRGAVTATES
jgi:hypothetical protein